MQSYLKSNKKIYDKLASEFEGKIPVRQENSLKAVELFLDNFKNPRKRLLELGPGSGWVSKLFIERGFSVTAIEFSNQMARVCQKTSPKTDLIIDEFLNHDFGKNKFSGIIALAFIHLFPKAESQKVLAKIKKLLDKNGVVLVSTTLHKKSEEGYFVKRNFNHKVKRFRRRFIRQELEKELHQAGFKIITHRDIPDKEEKGKIWMDYILAN